MVHRFLGTPRLTALQIYSYSKYDLLAAIQAEMVYSIMRIVDDGEVDTGFAENLIQTAKVSRAVLQIIAN